MYVAVEAELGYSFPELLDASHAYQAALMQECLADRGYLVRSTDLVDFFFSAGPLEPIEQARMLIDRTGHEPDSLAAIPSTAYDECTGSGHSPILALDQMLTVIDTEVGERVRGRSDVLEAREKWLACDQFRPPNSGTEWLQEAADKIVERFRSGDMTKESAFAELEELGEAEAENREEFVRECGLDFELVLERAVVEEQAAFLERNPTFMSDLAVEYQSELELLTEYLQ